MDLHTCHSIQMVQRLAVDIYIGIASLFWEESLMHYILSSTSEESFSFPFSSLS